MLTSKMFNNICSRNCQHCYHIKQKCCIFFSPKSFSDTKKVLKRCLRPGLWPGPGWGAHDAPQTP